MVSTQVLCGACSAREAADAGGALPPALDLLARAGTGALCLCCPPSPLSHFQLPATVGARTSRHACIACSTGGGTTAEGVKM